MIWKLLAFFLSVKEEKEEEYKIRILRSYGTNKIYNKTNDYPCYYHEYSD